MVTQLELKSKPIEEYFNFLDDFDIRIQGTRIGIENILFEYIEKNRSPEDILLIYPSLTLEQIYATIFYYLQNQEKISNYMTTWLEHSFKMREKQKLHPFTVGEKMRQLRLTKNLNLDSKIITRG
jgi:uncharacterized protein (DUF433 family)